MPGLVHQPTYGKDIVFVQDSFLSEKECQVLSTWTVANIEQSFFLPTCGRVSTRHARGPVPFPDLAYQTQRKIIELMGLHDAAKAPFCDGFYSGYARTGRECAYHPHRDPIYYPETYTLHCNVVTTDSPDGAVVIEGVGNVAMSKGRLVVYPVSELDHEVLAGNSSAPRNLWVFGFCVSESGDAK